MVKAKKILRKFYSDESGQSLAFAAITFFALMIVGLMIFGIGESTTTQMEIQNAADAGAYSSAQVLADSVSQIAWLNEAMAYIYYHNMRYAVDTVTTAVHAEIKEHPLYYGDATLFSGVLTPSDSVVGLRNSSGSIVNAVAAYNRAYSIASVEIPKGEEWLKILSRVQRGIALLTPKLVEHQAVHTALSNMKGFNEDEYNAGRTAQVAFWPRFDFAPHDATRRICNIERLENGGWYFWSDTNPFEFKIEHLSIWDEKKGETAGNIDHWKMHKQQGGNEVEMDVKVEKKTTPKVYTSKIIFEGHRNSEPFKFVVMVDPPPEGTVHVIDNGKTSTVSEDDPETPGIIKIVQDGKATYLRRNASGYMEYSKTSGGPWNALGGKTTTVDGVEIPVDHNPHIKIGESSAVRLGPPISIHFPEVNATLHEPVVLNFTSPFGWINVNEDRARINGLSTSTPSDQFRPLNYQSHSDGRTRHRLREIEPQVYNSENNTYEGGEWEYEWQRFGAYTEDMSMRTLAIHSIMNYDPIYNSKVPSDTRYSQPTKGTVDDNPNSDDALWQTTPTSSKWRFYPEWARPLRDGSDNNYGGWFSPEQGKPYSNTIYSQTRKCWYCETKGDVAGPLYDYYDPIVGQASPTVNQKCIRPCGFWYEKFTDLRGTPFHRQAAQVRVDALNAAWHTAGLPGYAAFIIPTGTPYTNPSQTMIQVTCPVCARKYAWSNEYNVSGRNPKCVDITELPNKPSYVRKYIAHAIGRHNPAIRSHSIYTRNVNPRQQPMERDYFGLRVAAHGDTTTWQPPLQLTAEFFRKGITIATWRESDEIKFFNKIGGKNPTLAQQKRGVLNPIKDSGWGHFGIATARLTFTNIFDINGNKVPPYKAYRFEWDPNSDHEQGSRPDSIDDSEEDIAPLGRPIHWPREMWLRSEYNLFDPDWGAILVSNRKSLNVHDLYSADDFDRGIVGKDNGSTYLLRHIRDADWCREINDLYRYWNGWHPTHYWNSISAPPMQKGGGRLDYSDPKMEEIIRH